MAVSRVYRKLSNPKRGVEWFGGRDHDLGLTDVMSHLVGVTGLSGIRVGLRREESIGVHGHSVWTAYRNNILLSSLWDISPHWCCIRWT